MSLVAGVMQVLRQCNGDFSRENIMRQANNLHVVEVPALLPGIRVNTSRTKHRRCSKCSCSAGRRTGWIRFGNIIQGANISLTVVLRKQGTRSHQLWLLPRYWPK